MRDTTVHELHQLKWSELVRLLLNCAVSKQNSINVVLLFVANVICMKEAPNFGFREAK